MEERNLDSLSDEHSWTALAGRASETPCPPAPTPRHEPRCPGNTIVFMTLGAQNKSRSDRPCSMVCYLQNLSPQCLGLSGGIHNTQLQGLGRAQKIAGDTLLEMPWGLSVHICVPETCRAPSRGATFFYMCV